MTEQQLRNQVVSTIKSWLGYSEKNAKHKKIIDIYNNHKPLARGYKVKYTDEWCATTVSAVAIQCGLTDIMPTECSCSKMVDLYKKLGRWQENDAYLPSPGDIIMYYWKDSSNYATTDCTGAPNHVGIVELVTGNVMTIIEGNKGETVDRRKVSVNGRYIRGYCLPNYASKATKTVTTNTVSSNENQSTTQKIAGAKSLDKTVKSGVKFKVTASALNVRSSASSSNKSNIIKTIKKDSIVTWYGYYTDSFYLVSLPDKTTGYVHKAYLNRI